MTDKSRQWWTVAALTTVATVAVVDRTILSLLFDPIRNDLQLSDTEMSLIFGLAFALSNVFCTLPAGYLADRISRRGLIAAGAALWSLMTSLCGYAGTFLQLLGARAGVGAAEAVIHPCANSLLRATLAPEHRGRGFAVYGMSIMGGSALGFLLGGGLIAVLTSAPAWLTELAGTAEPWRLALILLGMAGLPATLLMLTIREPQRSNDAATAEATVASAWRHFAGNWRLYVPLIAFSASLAMQSNAYGAFIASVPQRRWQVPVAEVGQQLGLIMLFAAPIGNWLVGWQMDRLGNRMGVRGLALVGCVVAALLTVFSSAAPAAPSPSWYFALAGCVFMFGGAGFAITASIIAALTPTQLIGKISALQLFIYGVVGMGSGPAIVGFVSDRYFADVPGGVAFALSRCSLAFTATSLLAMAVLALVAKHTASSRAA